MDLINEMVTPLDENREIDIPTLNRMVEACFSNHCDYTVLFSVTGDGPLLTYLEKEAILNSLNPEVLPRIFIYFQLENEAEDARFISLINRCPAEYVLVNPPLGYSYSQNGLFLYLRNILKKLRKKKVVLVNSPSSNPVCFHFQTLKKLIKAHPNLIGLYENSIDYSLLALLKQHFPTFKIYLNEKHIEKALKLQLDGIVSPSSLIFGEEYRTVIEDYRYRFTNRLLLDYLLLAHEILLFCNNSTLLKTYLKRKGYPSMEVRPPLIIEPGESDNLDLLLS